MGLQHHLFVFIHSQSARSVQSVAHTNRLRLLQQKSAAKVLHQVHQGLMFIFWTIFVSFLPRFRLVLCRTLSCPRRFCIYTTKGMRISTLRCLLHSWYLLLLSSFFFSRLVFSGTSRREMENIPSRTPRRLIHSSKRDRTGILPH